MPKNVPKIKKELYNLLWYDIMGKRVVYLSSRTKMEVSKMITEYLGIYQIHWCIHGSVVGLPFSLTDVATPEEASSIIEKTLMGVKEEKTLRELMKEKLSLSEALSFDR